MYKKREMILNPKINALIAQIGHFQQIVICDAGLPIPKDDNLIVIDLSLIEGMPSFKKVFEIFEEYMAIEKIYLAQEIQTQNLSIVYFLEDFPIKKEYVSHQIFKDLTKKAIAFIRTGEQSPYANAILVAGVNF